MKSERKQTSMLGQFSPRRSIRLKILNKDHKKRETEKLARRHVLKY